MPLDGVTSEALATRHACGRRDPEFTFPHNRRKTSGVTRIAARVIEQLVVRPPLTMRQLIDHTRWYRKFVSAQPATA